MRDTKMQGFREPDILINFAALWVGIALVLFIIIMAILQGEFGVIGRDSDDALRLVQIRDLLGMSGSKSQNWFDTTQYRLGLAGGTDMHWSRIPDIPIITLTAFFDLFVERETALKWAYSIWPPVSSLILVLALAKGARYWSAQRSEVKIHSHDRPNYIYIFTLILLSFFVFRFFRFTPGSIDHHNIQIGLVALSMAFALDPKLRFASFMLSGFAMAISVAIGVEVYIFAAIICGFIGLNWFIKGDSAARATQGFGLGLSAGLALAFFGTIAPAEYTVVACDALSAITLSAGAIGGLGLALATRLCTKDSFMARFAALFAVGTACLTVLLMQAPECISNPLNSLPDEVERLWLNEIVEAKPITLSMKDAAIEIPFMLGAPLLALVLLAFRILKLRQWSGQILVFLLLIGAIALTIHQQRFYPFAYIFALLPLASFVSDLYSRGVAAAKVPREDSKTPSNIAYIGALALSIPLFWAVPGYLLMDNKSPSASITKNGCYSAEVIEALNSLPLGLISATSSGGAPILGSTQHRALSGNYHRNTAGISAQIKIAVSSPQEAVETLRQNNIDYVHFCYPSSETESFIRENKDGFYSALSTKNIPDGLVKAIPDIGDDVIVSIYRVTK